VKGFGFVRVSVAGTAHPPTPAGGWSIWKVLFFKGFSRRGSTTSSSCRWMGNLEVLVFFGFQLQGQHIL
jgi:hypothetical protein